MIIFGRTESLARHLARAAGWDKPGRDEETLVTFTQSQPVASPQQVYSVPKDSIPVWHTFVDTAKAALEWVEKSYTIPD